MTTSFAMELAEAATFEAGNHTAWRDRVKWAIQDTFAAALASRRLDVVRRSRLYPEGRAGVFSWLEGTLGDPSAVIMHNSIAAHALDFDDANETWRGHYSGVVLPILIGLCEMQPSAAHRLVAAYAYGSRVAMAVGKGFNLTEHYRLGFHATCTVSGIASAAAGGYLLRFDALQLQSAINLAASSAVGFQETFGTAGKPLQVGRTAANAYLAIAFAQRGICVDGDVLAGRRGLFHLLSRDPRIDDARHSLAMGESIDTLSSSIKVFPCCYDLQRLAHAVSQLVTKNQIVSTAVREVNIEMHRGAMEPLIARWPNSVTEARFSPQFTVASLLRNHALGLSSYTDGSVTDPTLTELGRLIICREVESAEKIAKLTVKTSRGDFSNAVSIIPGSARGDWPPDLRDKERDCLAYGGWSLTVEDVESAAQELCEGELNAYHELMQKVCSD